MSNPRRRSAFSLLVASLILLLPAALHGQRLPELVVQAPPSLDAVRTRVEQFDRSRLASAMELVGLSEPGPPIQLVLTPENREPARRAPSWASGYAIGRASAVVIIPERIPGYPDRSLEAVIQHEVAHILVYRAAGGRPVPRWLNEGLAMMAARAWVLEDRTRMLVGMVAGDTSSLEEVDQAFFGGERQAAAAYAVSRALVEELVRRAGREAPAHLLRRLSLDQSFEEAFPRVTGLTVEAFARSFWRRHNLIYRWVPFLTSAVTIWLAVTLIAVAAFWRRRRIDAERYRRWEEEDEARALAQARRVGESEESSGGEEAEESGGALPPRRRSSDEPDGGWVH